MGRSVVHAAIEDLKSASKAFERWRRSGSPGARIPESLWEVAVDAGREHGVHRTAKALRLNYYALKKRMARESGSEARVRSGEERARFVEVSPLELSSPPSCTLELEAGVGTTHHVRMKVEVGGASLDEVGALIERIWSSSR